jgi:hypothetical protein
MMKNDEVLKFSLDIEEIVYMKDVSYMDAVVMYCEERDMEIEVAAKLLSPLLKSKIKVEAEELNYLPKSNTIKLPL